ncbi:MAG TPA: PfkB family carbohydrate kinase [Gemmatimonadales bacterium]|nr:PfkB family carbohydrate kinase [Gemmatimonadales bacterium]
MRLGAERLEALLARMQGRRIAVVGDVMLDRYLVGDTGRISPEAPVPVVKIERRRVAPGGAANVAANVAALGGHARLVGVVGRDPPGDLLRRTLADLNTSDEWLVSSNGRPTTQKTRVVARGQQVVRIDEEVDGELDGSTAERLTAMAATAIAEADALILEDYNKGVLSPTVIRRAMEAAHRRRIPIVVDPKYENFFSFSGATVLKPNRRELKEAFGASLDLEATDALALAAKRLGAACLLVTLGAEGMILQEAGGAAHRIPGSAEEVYDVSGAGDTVTAWVAAALAAGATPLEAAMLANLAAGVEVRKAGVATVTPAEVRKAAEKAGRP